MKLILCALFLCLVFKGHGQPADTTKMMKMVVPPDSVAIVSLRDYSAFFTWLQENVSKAQYDKLTPDQVLNQFFQWAIVEFNRRKKK